MHHALQISDIVCTIVQCLSQPPISVYTDAYDATYHSYRERLIKRKALLSLSLTSRSMLEPCLDALWGCMLSARPLFDNIVPPERKARPEGRSRQPYHQFMGLSRFLENADWTRFQYYASRVKGLRVAFGDLDVIFGRVLSSRSSARAGPLLPHLRYLHWDDYRNASLPCLSLLAGPNVISLRLNLIVWQRNCQESFHTTLLPLREVCPLLENINIVHCREVSRRDTKWQLELMFSVFSVFLNVTNVEFTCEPPGDLLICLSRMSNLRSLKGGLPPGDHFIMDHTAPLDFPSLQHLDWVVSNPDEALSLLHLLCPSGGAREFKTLKIYHDSIITTTELKAFLGTLLATCSTRTLSSFTLEADGPVLEQSDGIDVLQSASAYLHPLLQFGQIEKFRIGGLPVQLDDAFVAAVATMWPRLRVLHLYTVMPSWSAITPAGLLPLARESRRLEDLGVSVDSWPCPILPPPRGHVATGRRDVLLFVHVHHYIVNCSGSCEPEGDTQRAARIQSLWEIFPNASDIEYYCTS